MKDLTDEMYLAAVRVWESLTPTMQRWLLMAEMSPGAWYRLKGAPKSTIGHLYDRGLCEQRGAGSDLTPEGVMVRHAGATQHERTG